MASLKSVTGIAMDYVQTVPMHPAAVRVYAYLLRKLRLIPEFKAAQNNPVRRVLIIGLSKHVGDTVMMLPMVDMIHDADPLVEIEMAVAVQVASFLRSVPYIAQVHGIDVGPAKIPFLSRFKFLWNVISYARCALYDKDYDICLLPRWGKDPYLSSYLAYLTSAPVRCGQDPDEEFNIADDFPGTKKLMTIAVQGGHGLPDAVRQLRLLPAAGLIQSIDETSAAGQPIRALSRIAQTVDFHKLCDRLHIDASSPYAVIAPGASHPRKWWPLERYSEVVTFVRNSYSLNCVVIGSPSEQQIGMDIEKLTCNDAISIMGKTSLEETMAILSHASTFIGNDSGPGHIAAGLGIPSIIVSVCARSIKEDCQSSPSRVRPVGPKFVVVQPEFPAQPCGNICEGARAHCILGVSVEAVIKEIEKLMPIQPHLLGLQANVDTGR
ncbi:MAG: glycosyltransferase family 9 protein [Acidobacteriaceae bacterium]